MLLDKDLQELFSRYQETFTDFDGVVISDINHCDLTEDSLLHLAARHNELADVKLLLRFNADVNARGDMGLIPLHWAASNGNLDIVKVLIEHGADKSLRDEFGDLPIDWAKRNGHSKVVKFLNRK